MPVMKRVEWFKVSPAEKVMRYAYRTIDRLDAVQARYDRVRSSGKFTVKIAFLERSE